MNFVKLSKICPCGAKIEAFCDETYLLGRSYHDAKRVIDIFEGDHRECLNPPYEGRTNSKLGSSLGGTDV